MGGVQNPGHFRYSYDRQGSYIGQISRTRVTLVPLMLMVVLDVGGRWTLDGNPGHSRTSYGRWGGLLQDGCPQPGSPLKVE